MKIRKVVLISALVVVSVNLAPRRLPAQNTPTHAETITSARPLNEAAERLRNLYGKVITYEDPVWVWRDELQPTGLNPNAKFGLVPKPLTFVMPGEAGTEPNVEKVLARTLEEYHRLPSGPRFQVLRSSLGLHIVPVQVRDERGQMVPASNLMDTKVSVPVEERRPSEHIRAVIAAVEASTGVPLGFVVGLIPRQPRDPFEQLFASNPETFQWGAANVVARDAVVELLDRSATSFAWELRCVASPQSQDRRCSFGIIPIEVTITDADGQKVNRGLFYDRCGKCEPLYPSTNVLPPGRPQP